MIICVLLIFYTREFEGTCGASGYPFKQAGRNVQGADGGAAVAEWLSSWLAEQEVRGLILSLATLISEIGYLLLPSRHMAEIPLKRLKSSIQPTNQRGTDVKALVMASACVRKQKL